MRLMVRVVAAGAVLSGLTLLQRACAVADLTLPPPGQLRSYQEWFARQCLLAFILILLGCLVLWREWRGERKPKQP
jgi:ABC-type nickel/cobalt efflux system permease component RcnA